VAKRTVSASLRQQDAQAMFITRYHPMLARPESLPIQGWRDVVKSQEVVGIARDTIISYMISTPWRIEPRDPDVGNRYDKEIQYYTDLFNGTDGGYIDHLELVLQDFLDTPLGGCTELAREPDAPGGRVVNYQNMDAATLSPTAFKDFPIIQRVPGIFSDPPLFPAHAISRIGWSPRPEIRQRGWYMAPPERILLALQMLVQGDQYYWKLLQDTPEQGILDLGDMERSSAESWLSSWKDLLGGIDPFKIPVLFEHTTDVKYITFNRPPSDIIYDKITMMRASFAAGGYGITLTDMGLIIDSNTLAGTIRGERRSERTGFAKVRAKVASYWQKMLPAHLTYSYVERDDERLVAKGRARLANSMAMRNLTEARIISSQDAQQQLVSDGLMTVPLQPTTAVPNSNGEIVEPNRLVSRELGSPVPASAGGEGEVSARSMSKDLVYDFLKKTGFVENTITDDVLGFDLIGEELKETFGGVLALKEEE
jgi:hypothetical protein